MSTFARPRSDLTADPIAAMQCVVYGGDCLLILELQVIMRAPRVPASSWREALCSSVQWVDSMAFV